MRTGIESLKLKDLLKKDRSHENLKALQNLIQTDIIGSINKNVALGNISMDDARRLRNLTGQLYDHLYAHYEEMEETNMLTDESLLLEYDIIEMEHEKALAEKDKIIQEKDSALQEKEKELQASQFEIERLKTELEKLLQR